MSSFSIAYILGFSRGGVRDNLTYCVHLKRELKFSIGFDFLPSHFARIPHYSSFLCSWRQNTQGRVWRQGATKLWSVGTRITVSWHNNKKNSICLWMAHYGELWQEIVEVFTEFYVVWSLANKNSRHWALKGIFLF